MRSAVMQTLTRSAGARHVLESHAGVALDNVGAGEFDHPQFDIEQRPGRLDAHHLA